MKISIMDSWLADVVNNTRYARDRSRLRFLSLKLIYSN